MKKISIVTLKLPICLLLFQNLGVKSGCLEDSADFAINMWCSVALLRAGSTYIHTQTWYVGK